MDAPRPLLLVGLILMLVICAGCVSDDVVYVDESGREIAVDQGGKPVSQPGTAGVMREGAFEEAPYAPPAAYEPAVPERSNPIQPTVPPPFAVAPAGPSAPSRAGTPATNEDLPPAGPGATPLSTPPTAAAARKAASAPQAPAAPKVVPEPAPAPEEKVPAKKIDSSSGLDLPPAG